MESRYTTWNTIAHPFDRKQILRRLIMEQTKPKSSRNRELIRTLTQDLEIAKNAKAQRETFPVAQIGMKEGAFCSCPRCGSSGRLFRRVPLMSESNPIWRERGQWNCLNCFAGDDRE